MKSASAAHKLAFCVNGDSSNVDIMIRFFSDLSKSCQVIIGPVTSGILTRICIGNDDKFTDFVLTGIEKSGETFKSVAKTGCFIVSSRKSKTLEIIDGFNQGSETGKISVSGSGRF